LKWVAQWLYVRRAGGGMVVQLKVGKGRRKRRGKNNMETHVSVMQQQQT